MCQRARAMVCGPPCTSPCTSPSVLGCRCTILRKPSWLCWQCMASELALTRWQRHDRCIAGAGDKLKSEADAALQAQLQRQEHLAETSEIAAQATYEGVRMEANSGITACESGAANAYLCEPRVGYTRQPSCIMLSALQQSSASSAWVAVAAAESLEASQLNWSQAVQGGLHAVNESVSAAGATVQEADQLAAGTPADFSTCTCVYAPVPDNSSAARTANAMDNPHTGLVHQHGGSKTALSEGVQTLIAAKYRERIPVGKRVQSRAAWTCLLPRTDVMLSIWWASHGHHVPVSGLLICVPLANCR